MLFFKKKKDKVNHIFTYDTNPRHTYQETFLNLLFTLYYSYKSNCSNHTLNSGKMLNNSMTYNEFVTATIYFSGSERCEEFIAKCAYFVFLSVFFFLTLFHVNIINTCNENHFEQNIFKYIYILQNDKLTRVRHTLCRFLIFSKK